MIRSRYSWITALLLPACLFPMTGCLVRTRNILIETPPDVVMSASNTELVNRINADYDKLQTMTAKVNFTATVNHSDTGVAKDYTGWTGYILIKKPDMMRFRGLVPISETVAFDMVSDGTTFTMSIPHYNKVITGGMTVTKPSKNLYENLRPGMFIDSMLVKRIDKDELVSVTSDTRILNTNSKVHHVIEEPDYNVSTYRKNPNSNQLIPLRVIHISRRTLQPYQLDVYDDSGKIVTQATYENYTEYGTLLFPSRITIGRPQENMTVTLDVVKLDVNQTFEDDTFKLDIPSGATIEKLP